MRNRALTPVLFGSILDLIGINVLCELLEIIGYAVPHSNMASLAASYLAEN